MLHRLLPLLLTSLAAAVVGAAPAAADPGPTPVTRMSTSALELGDLPFGFPAPPHAADRDAGADREDEDAEGEDGDAEGDGKDVSGPSQEEERRPTPRADPGLGPVATIPRDTRPLRLATSRVAARVGTAFAGPTLSDSGSFPPDSMGDVGPTQFLVGVNGRLRSYSKATGLPDGGIDVGTDAFFSLAPPAFGSDPRVRFDRRSGRWIIVMIDIPDGAGQVENHVHIAVSDGATLSGSTVWTFHQFGSETGEFLDYPTLGVDGDALYIGGAGFTLTGSYQASRAYVVNKASALGTGALAVARFTTSSGSSGAGASIPQGVDARDGSGAGHGYFVGVDNASFSQLDVVRIDNPGTTPTIGATTTVAVPTTTFPITVPHLGNTGGTNGQLDALDDRLFNATLRNGHIYAAHNIKVNASGVGTSAGDRDGARWYDLNVTGTPALSQSGTVYDSAASSPRSYWIPSVGVNGQNTLVVAGSVAGTTAAANAWVTSRASTYLPGQLDAPTTYSTSTASYNPPSDPGGSGGRRWGDYSFVGVDPQDDQTLWTIQEYTASTNVWGVRIAKVLAAPPATPGAVQAPGGAASTTVTVDGTGGTWFDPGAGFPQRLRVTAGCGVTVNGVTVQSATRLALDLDTRAATAGPCDLTVTNPDGQAATGTRVLTVAVPPTTTTTTTTPTTTTDTTATTGAVTATPPAPATTTATTTSTTTTTTTTTATARPRCVVPRLRGHSLRWARARLRRAHCATGRLRRVTRHGGTVRRGRVLASSPKAGARRPSGTRIKLTLRR